MKLRRFRDACAVLTICVLAAACSSATRSGSTSSANGEIVVGDVGSYSGAFASTFGGVPKVLDAWAQMVNDGGGLQGHHVRVIHEDLGNAAGTGLVAVKKLITQAHIVAIISDLDNSDQTWLPYAKQMNVPVIITQATGAAMTDADAFPTLESPVAMGYMQAKVAGTVGKRLGEVYCAEAAGCAQNDAYLKQFANILGLELPVAIKEAGTLPDYTAVCQELKAANVDVYELAMAATVDIKIADTCYATGLKIPLLSLGGPPAQWKTDKVFVGSYVADLVAPYFDNGTPGLKTYRDALSKYVASLVGTSLDNSVDLYAWTGAQLFSAAVAKISGAVTAASVRQGLYALKDETLGGIVGPLNFTPGKPTLNKCFFVWKVGSGTFVAQDGDQPTCAPADVLKPVEDKAIQALGK